MTREIKFCGIVKGLDIKRWAYGGIFYSGKRAFIVSDDVEIFEGTVNSSISDFIEVIPETVGQYIEMKDKKKVEIYEGSKIKFQQVIYEVKMWNGSWCLWLVENGEGRVAWYMYQISGAEYEVIGNIHDEKEKKCLIEKK